MEQTTLVVIPARSMEANSDSTVPSVWALTLPSLARAGMVLTATASGKAWV
ncbi:MAG: hypothetical protein NTY00_01200 [Deltaproteobacteria bacterium]|nr:hypothetical protein [Deltaproteobacteria bacterium]